MWGTAQRAATRRCTSDWGRNLGEGRVKIPFLATSRVLNAVTLAYTANNRNVRSVLHVPFQRYCRFSVENSHPTFILADIWGCFHIGVAYCRSRMLGSEVLFMYGHDRSTSQTDRRTTQYAVYVHRAVKRPVDTYLLALIQQCPKIRSPVVPNTVYPFYSLPMFPGLRHVIISATTNGVLLHRTSHLKAVG